jgi:flagellin
MRINHNISSMITQSALYQVGQQMQTSLQRLSTGLRINSAADDAAGLGISENLRTQVNGTAQATRNAQDGIAALTIAEGAGNEVSSILQRMRELAVQTSNDTLTSTERAYSEQEFSALNSEIDRISNATNYNKQQLISSTANRFGAVGMGNNQSTLWVDANSVNGVDSITISIATLTTTAGGLNISAQTLNTQTDSVNAISSLDTAIDSVNKMRSDLGAYINRLEHAINNLQVSNTNQQAAESDIRDVDFAAETSQFTRNQILQQSGTAMLAQANAIPQSVLTLLK